jgi:N-acyl homoserine lactone hydrolase
MRLYAFHGGGEKGLMSTFNPFDPNAGAIVDIPYFFYLIQHPRGNVLFDTGGHPDLIDRAEERLGASTGVYEITMKAGDDVVSQLAQSGVGTGDVTHVVMSHLHYDHAGGIEFFPDATFYVQREELRFAHWPAIYQRSIYVRRDFDHPVRWRELTGDYDIFGDGRVVAFPTPGHTPGHQSLLVQLDNRTMILTADAAYMPETIDERILPGIVWSPDAMVASWERIEDLKRKYSAGLLFTHNLSWPQTTRVGPTAWYE